MSSVAARPRFFVFFRGAVSAAVGSGVSGASSSGRRRRFGVGLAGVAGGGCGAEVAVLPAVRRARVTAMPRGSSPLALLPQPLPKPL